MKKVEKEFQQINSLIERHWARAIGLANAESRMTYWAIGAYVSAKLKTAEWGSKVIEELCDFLKTHNPKRRGFGKRHIYNMVKSTTPIPVLNLTSSMSGYVSMNLCSCRLHKWCIFRMHKVCS